MAINNVSTDSMLPIWKKQAPKAYRDLILKKIAVSIIALLNFAALGAVMYCIIAFTPVPTQSLFVSPFIIGVLAALANLKFPTFGISEKNYVHYINPISVIGRGLAYIFFGPLMYAVEQIDRNPYHDPCLANKISNDLENLTFDQISNAYGGYLDNLVKYGFIPKENKAQMKQLHDTCQPLIRELDFWKTESLQSSLESQEAQKKVDQVNAQWETLKVSLINRFPHPEKPKHDFTKLSTRIKLKFRSLCCFGPLIIMQSNPRARI